MTALALVLAVLIGVMLGALGSGGSIVTLPVLVYVAGVPPHEAVGVSMAVVGATSLLGALLHFFRGNRHLKATALFGATGIAGAQLGSAVTHRVSGPALMLIFTGVAIAVAILMLRGHGWTSSGRCSVTRCAGIGFAVGTLTGFLGVGGGFLIVPALVLLGGVEPNKAIGASLAVIAINSFAGLAGQLRRTSLDLPLAGMFLAAAAVGIPAGVRIGSRLPAAALRRVFAWFLLATALAIASANGWLLASGGFEQRPAGQGRGLSVEEHDSAGLRER